MKSDEARTTAKRKDSELVKTDILYIQIRNANGGICATVYAVDPVIVQDGGARKNHVRDETVYFPIQLRDNDRFFLSR